MSARTTPRNETQIVADPGQPTILVTREFDAAPARVFRACTDPDLVVRWMSPRRLTMEIVEFDARTGGSYRYLHREADGTEHAFRGVFHEVRPVERIVQTFTYEGFPDGVSLEIAVLDDLDGRTRMTATSVLDSVESRDAFIATGMESGLREAYDQLEELLAATA